MLGRCLWNRLCQSIVITVQSKQYYFLWFYCKINIKKERKLMSLILSSLPNDILEPSYHVIMKLIVISKCNKRWLGGGKNTQSLKCYAKLRDS